MNIKTRMEYGSPVSAFEIKGLYLTNRQAYALIDMAKMAGTIDFGRENFQEDEFEALDSAISEIALTLQIEGWTKP
jgi:hypothetical protein